MKTIVINLLGGPGSGKSTSAADLYKELKIAGFSVELVREVVKELAYEGIKPDTFMRPYLFGKQAREESRLFGKVQVVITDSPVYLDAFYEKRYSGTNIVQAAVFEYIKEAEKKGVTYFNFFMKRTQSYQTEGRYESEEEAKEVDLAMKKWLDEKEISYTYVDSEDKNKAKYILNRLHLLKKGKEYWQMSLPSNQMK